jgi:hypothetical protein
MKLHQLLLVATLLSLGACVIEDDRPGPDPHRAWWGEHHPQEAYDHDRAEHEHRDWCARTPDQTCQGWR